MTGRPVIRWELEINHSHNSHKHRRKTQNVVALHEYYYHDYPGFHYLFVHQEKIQTDKYIFTNINTHTTLNLIFIAYW